MNNWSRESNTLESQNLIHCQNVSIIRINSLQALATVLRRQAYDGTSLWRDKSQKTRKHYILWFPAVNAYAIADHWAHLSALEHELLLLGDRTLFANIFGKKYWSFQGSNSWISEIWMKYFIFQNWGKTPLKHAPITQSTWSPYLRDSFPWWCLYQAHTFSSPNQFQRAELSLVTSMNLLYKLYNF